MFNKIKNMRTIAIVAGVILVCFTIIKIIDLIRDTGLVKNKDEKIGELKVVKNTYKENNKQLAKAIKLIKQVNEQNDKVIINLIDEDKNITKTTENVKEKVKKKIIVIKKTGKKVPKNINDHLYFINPFVYKEAGKTMINAVWKMYNNVKDKK